MHLNYKIRIGCSTQEIVTKVKRLCRKCPYSFMGRILMCYGVTSELTTAISQRVPVEARKDIDVTYIF